MMVDTWYHFGHRLMHKNEWLWTHIHAHHHEKKNLNVWATAYTEFVENLVLIAPVLMGSHYTYYCLSPTRFNQLAWIWASIAQTIIFNMGSCSPFATHPFPSCLHT